MFVTDYYGHKLSNGVLFAHHLILGVPGGSSHLAYRRRVPLWHNPHTRVKALKNDNKAGWEVINCGYLPLDTIYLQDEIATHLMNVSQDEAGEDRSWYFGSRYAYDSIEAFLLKSAPGFR